MNIYRVNPGLILELYYIRARSWYDARAEARKLQLDISDAAITEWKGPIPRLAHTRDAAAMLTYQELAEQHTQSIRDAAFKDGRRVGWQEAIAFLEESKPRAGKVRIAFHRAMLLCLRAAMSKGT